MYVELLHMHHRQTCGAEHVCNARRSPFCCCTRNAAHPLPAALGVSCCAAVRFTRASPSANRHTQRPLSSTGHSRVPGAEWRVYTGRWWLFSPGWLIPMCGNKRRRTTPRAQSAPIERCIRRVGCHHSAPALQYAIPLIELPASRARAGATHTAVRCRSACASDAHIICVAFLPAAHR